MFSNGVAKKNQPPNWAPKRFQSFRPLRIGMVVCMVCLFCSSDQEPPDQGEERNDKSTHAKKKWLTLNGCFLKWWYPQIIHFNRVFHYKPSILGYNYFRKPPNKSIGLFLLKEKKQDVFKFCVCLFFSVGKGEKIQYKKMWRKKTHFLINSSLSMWKRGLQNVLPNKCRTKLQPVIILPWKTKIDPQKWWLSIPQKIHGTGIVAY